MTELYIAAWKHVCYTSDSKQSLPASAEQHGETQKLVIKLYWEKQRMFGSFQRFLWWPLSMWSAAAGPLSAAKTVQTVWWQELTKGHPDAEGSGMNMSAHWRLYSQYLMFVWTWG